MRSKTLFVLILLVSSVVCKTVPDTVCGGCFNQGVCAVEHDHVPYCICTERFYGTHCEIDMYRRFGFDCRYDGNCMNGGDCIVTSGICRCQYGYHGEKCELKSDDQQVSTSSVIGISVGLAATVIILVVYLCMRYGIGQIIREKRARSSVPVLTITGFPCRLHESYESAIDEVHHWLPSETDTDENGLTPTQL
ncbi:protein lag-2-like [Ptychodera flava]|uniref:protein lag-2-like n=1 Tax=Ptychodera flava TaxID=63121 RepID=UPI00396AAD1A